MSLGSSLGAVVHHRMRAYYVPFAAGWLLVCSAFMPWIFVDDLALGGVPDLSGFWILALGILSIVLASLSMITRKNSRHPLLVVGLVAFAIVFLSEKLMERSAAQQVWAIGQAQAIVEGISAPVQPQAIMGVGAYLGLIASTILVIFGLTIVVKRVSQPYIEPADDDI